MVLWCYKPITAPGGPLPLVGWNSPRPWIVYLPAGVELTVGPGRNHDMIEGFIRQYSERAYQFAYGLCGNAEDAKELVQEAFCRLIARWDQYDSSQPLENWFLTILRNLYYDSLKRYERRHGTSLDARFGAEEDSPTLADTLADGRDEPFLAALERQEAAQRVRAVLAGLRPEHSAILALADMQALTYEEIAAVLDCPLGTVRSRLSRARAAFRRAMTQADSEVHHDVP